MKPVYIPNNGILWHSFAYVMYDMYRNGEELARKVVAEGRQCGCSIKHKCFICEEKEKK